MGYLAALKSPISRDANLSNLQLKENIEKALNKKQSSFNILVQLNTQIEKYRTKALQIVELAKQYKNTDQTTVLPEVPEPLPY